MTQHKVQSIVQLFHTPSKHLKKNIQKLVRQSFSIIGQQQSFNKIKEWQTLSLKMDSLPKLRSLSDNNHRLLLIQFIKFQAVKLYNNSYFNHAKISQEYVSYLQQVGPFYFTQIITIVSKLKLIHKHYHAKLTLKQFSQNHIDIKIIKLLEMCNCKQRKYNRNIHKFQAIVQNEEDRDDLVKELGKMLRISWALEKKIVTEVHRSRLEVSSCNGSQWKHFHELIEVQSLNGERYGVQSSEIYPKCTNQKYLFSGHV